MLDLKTMFAVTAFVEAIYGAAGLLIPPSLTSVLLGWNLSPDGQWVTKLLGAALSAQAATAWVLRKDPPLAVAWTLTAYQFAAVFVDVVLWLSLADQGIFASPLARYSVIAAIPTHFLLGLLLASAALREGRGFAGARVGARDV